MSTKNEDSKLEADPLDQEVDFSRGIQGYFVKRRKGDVRLVLLEGELARRFQSDAEILRVLKAYLKTKGKAG